MSEFEVVSSHGYWSSAVESFDEVRGPNGEPNLTDFQTIDHPRLEWLVKVSWAKLPTWDEQADYRVLTHVGAFAIYIVIVRFDSGVPGRLEMVDLLIDLYPPL